MGRSREDILECWIRRCGLPADLLDVREAPPASEVSHELAAADLFVAPLADGVSSRRTTVAAALAHGLPVVGTSGPSTDAWLADSPAVALVAADDGPALVAHLDALAVDPSRRAVMAHAARDLYEGQFTWDAIARAYLRHLAA
jgi:glycosyltransferase involved in cell wall biosynthesis